MGKLDDFMAKKGKTLKPGREKKDGAKLTDKEIKALTLQMLKDHGYIS